MSEHGRVEGLDIWSRHARLPRQWCKVRSVSAFLMPAASPRRTADGFALFGRHLTSIENGLASIVGTVDRISARMEAPSAGFRIPMMRRSSASRMGTPQCARPNLFPFASKGIPIRSSVIGSARRPAANGLLSAQTDKSSRIGSREVVLCCEAASSSIRFSLTPVRGVSQYNLRFR